MINFIKKILKKKILAGFIILAIVGAGYFGYRAVFPAQTVTTYLMATAQKDLVITTVSGTGQVSASNQVVITPKASGTVVYVGVQDGQAIQENGLIVQLDTTDAQKTVRDAQANLDAAKISLAKLQEPPDQLSIIQDQNAITQAQQSKTTAQSNLVKDYDNGFNTVASAFIDLPQIMQGLNGVLSGTDITKGQVNSSAYRDMIINLESNVDSFKNAAVTGYQTALTAYDQNLVDYKNASRYSDNATVDALISETYDTTKSLAEALKDAKNFLDLVNDTLVNHSPAGVKVPAILTTHETSLQTYIGTINTDLGTLLSSKNSIQSDKDSITNADLTITQTTEALAKLKAGADLLDIQSAQLAVTQKQNALLDAQQNLADYYVRAPFSGIIAKVNPQKGDSVSSGTAVATLIAKQQVAEISFNEVDAAKVKVGQKATMTFDAVDGLIMSGKVAEIDVIGTVSQGVVTYNVKIAFDTQDDRIKAGMSVSADIITNSKADVLTVPSSAVKSQGNASYVEMPVETVDAAAATSAGVILNNTPKRQTVQTGLSNDILTEITSGLNEGDLVIIKTLTGTAAKTPTPQSGGGGGLRIPGVGGGMLH